MTSSPFDPDRSLTPEQRAAEPTLPKRAVEDTRGRPAKGYRIQPAARLFVRGPWETAASILIGLGVAMLMQPFFMVLYTWSFAVILTGTVTFIVVSHFPD
ncbi:MAG: hypothetical protein ACFBWO_02425 [Paracoccaceae bacterium]